MGYLALNDIIRTKQDTKRDGEVMQKKKQLDLTSTMQAYTYVVVFSRNMVCMHVALQTCCRNVQSKQELHACRITDVLSQCNSVANRVHMHWQTLHNSTA